MDYQTKISKPATDRTWDEIGKLMAELKRRLTVLEQKVSDDEEDEERG